MASEGGLFQESIGNDGALIYDHEIGPNDVILGRGKSNIKHPGNGRYHDIINRNREVYFAASTNQEKKDITERILAEIGGRFIRRNKEDTEGIMISKKDARIKIAQSLQYRQRQVSLSSSALSAAAAAAASADTKVQPLGSDRTTAAAAAPVAPSSSVLSAAVVAGPESATHDVFHLSDLQPISLHAVAARSGGGADGTYGAILSPSPGIQPLHTASSSATASSFQQPLFPATSPVSSSLFRPQQPPQPMHSDDMRWATAAAVPSAAIGGLAPLQPYHHTNLNVSQQHEEQIDDDDDDDAIGIAYTDLPKQPSQQHHQQQYPRF